MTVRELKKALQGVADNLEVVINHPQEMYYTGNARAVPKCSIGNAEFWIDTGEGFEY